MVTTNVLIKAETSRIPDLADQIADLEGIVETETMIAFRVYSKQELEAGFELGLD